MTEYLVMQRFKDGDSNEEAWRDLGTHEAVNQRQAIKSAMKEAELETGSFRAFPNTSAKTHTVETETHAVWS